MLQRPPFPRINRNSPLAKGLVFAGLGGPGVPGTSYIHNAAMLPVTATHENYAFGYNNWVWINELGRFGCQSAGTVPRSIEVAFTLSGSEPFTIACWANPAAAGIAGYHSGGYELGLRIVSDKAQLLINALGVNDRVSSVASTALGQLHHWAGMWGGTGLPMTIYHDGVGASVATSGTWEGAPLIRFGRFDGRVSGTITSDQMIWNRALSTSEIQQLADPSNVMLSGLIRAPRRRLFAVAAAPAFKPAWARRRNNLIGACV